MGASTLFSPVIQASLPARACFSGRTLRNSQHWALPHGQFSAPAAGWVTVRFRSYRDRIVSTYSSVSGKWEPVSRKTTSTVGSTLTAMSMSTASWNEAAMASFDPKRSTAQATIRPAGAVSKAADCSSSSLPNFTNSDSLATMLTSTILSVPSPRVPGRADYVDQSRSRLVPYPAPRCLHFV